MFSSVKKMPIRIFVGKNESSVKKISRLKKYSAKKLVTGKKMCHFLRTFFLPIRYILLTGVVYLMTNT